MYNDQIQKLRRRELRKNQTEAEKLLWDKIRNRKINNLKFHRQYGAGPYILDFFCPEIRLAIELDGDQHKDAKEYDKERELFLKEKDIRTIRFWNNEILSDINKVLDKIKYKIMNAPFLSYLMGAENIKDSDLTDLDVEIVETRSNGDRSLKIPQEKLSQYIELMKFRLDNGFWNEMVGAKEIIFIFKHKDGSIQEYRLSPDNEQEIDKLCAKFNNEQPDKTANVYKYISDNKFYHDFMLEHYVDLINRG